MFCCNRKISWDKFIEAAKTGGNAGLTTVQFYIEENQNNVAAINKPDAIGRTALHYASRNNHLPIVLALLAAKGININPIDNHSNTPFIDAAYKGNTPIVQAFLANGGVHINHVGQYGNTALISASCGHADTVDTLLEQEGVENDIANKLGQTALMTAAQGDIDIVRALLVRETLNTINLRNRDGLTAAQLAQQKGRQDIAQLIMEREQTLRQLASNPSQERNQLPLFASHKEGQANNNRVSAPTRAESSFSYRPSS